MKKKNTKIYYIHNNLLCIGGVASTPEARQVSITFDAVGKVEDTFAQLTAERTTSSLRKDNTYTRYIIVEHIPVPHFKPQLLTQLH